MCLDMYLDTVFVFHSSKDEADTAVDVDISLPENLRKQLEEDWMLIKQRDKVNTG